RYWGPKSFVTMLATNVMLVTFIGLFYKELKLMSFDETAARLFGFKPGYLHVAWLTLVSITAVVAFEIAGTVLVVALMIAPAAAANLVTKRLSKMLVVSVVLGLVSAVLGTWLGYVLEISPTSPIAFCSGLIFVALFICCASRRKIRRNGIAHE
ncbi:MAG: iron chelate uptake ABC transporter family permease subunit, partial [Planctomycetota bacterium]